MPRFKENLNTLEGFSGDLDKELARLRFEEEAKKNKKAREDKTVKKRKTPRLRPESIIEDGDDSIIGEDDPRVKKATEDIQKGWEVGTKEEQEQKQQKFVQETEALGLEVVNDMIDKIELSERPNIPDLALLYLQREYLESYDPELIDQEKSSIGFGVVKSKEVNDHNDLYGRKPKKDDSRFTGQVGSLLNTQAGAGKKVSPQIQQLDEKYEEGAGLIKRNTEQSAGFLSNEKDPRTMAYDRHEKFVARKKRQEKERDERQREEDKNLVAKKIKKGMDKIKTLESELSQVEEQNGDLKNKIQNEINVLKISIQKMIVDYRRDYGLSLNEAEQDLLPLSKVLDGQEDRDESAKDEAEKSEPLAYNHHVFGLPEDEYEPAMKDEEKKVSIDRQSSEEKEPTVQSIYDVEFPEKEKPEPTTSEDPLTAGETPNSELTPSPTPVAPEEPEIERPNGINEVNWNMFLEFRKKFFIGIEAYFGGFSIDEIDERFKSLEKIKIDEYIIREDGVYVSCHYADVAQDGSFVVCLFQEGAQYSTFNFSNCFLTEEERLKVENRLQPKQTEAEQNNQSPGGEADREIDLALDEKCKKIGEYLDSMYSESEVAREQLDKRSERIFSRIEQKWQWLDRLNLDTLLKRHNIDIDEWKPTSKPLKVAKFLAKGVLKNAFSLKTAIGLGILGTGILGAGGATAFFAAAKAGEMSALGFLTGRRIVSGLASGSAILFGGEALKKQKAKKRLEEIQNMVKEDTIFQKSGSELSQLIAEYQFASALMGIKLENDDPVYNTMVRTNADIIFEQIQAEENLDTIDYFVDNKIVQADLALERQFAKGGKKRVARAAVATAVAIFVATGLPGKAMAKAWGFALDQVGLDPDSSDVSEVIGSGQGKGGSAVLEDQSGEARTPDQIVENNSEVNIPKSNPIEEAVESRAGAGTQQTAEQITSTSQDIKPPIVEGGIKLHPHETYMGQRIDALVDENDRSIISVLRRQLEAQPERFGYTGKPGAAMHAWAEQKANNIAFNEGYGDVLVKEPGKISYILEAQKDAGGKIVDYNIHEVDYQSGQELDLNAGKLNPYEYPATPKILPVEESVSVSPTPKIEDLYPKSPQIAADGLKSFTRPAINEVNNFLKVPNFDASGAIINSEKETGFMHVITEATRNYVKGADSREVDLFARHVVDNPKMLGNAVSPESLKGSFLNFREQAHSYELPSPDKHFWQPRMLFHEDGQHSMINVKPVKGSWGSGYVVDFKGGDNMVVSPVGLEKMITPIRVVENCYDSNINPGTKLSALIKAIEEDRSFTYKGSVFSKSNGQIFCQVKGRGTPTELTYQNFNKVLGLKEYKPHLSAASVEKTHGVDVAEPAKEVKKHVVRAHAPREAEVSNFNK